MPLAVTRQYLPALDGLRALAVAGVFAYHLGLGFASGGYLGVDLFFVLSGFLITSLLLEEWALSGGIRLLAFWGRRARRLLPALFLLLIAIAAFVVLYSRFGPPGASAQIDLSGLRGDGVATLFYVANWHAIFAHESYFAQFAAPSPLQHTWSLAIEEQYYLVWPLVLLLVLTRFPTLWRRVGLAVSVGLGLVSAGLMALLYHPGANPTPVYFGTETRVFDMLAGAALAMIAAARPQPGPRSRAALHVAGPVAAVALGVFWATAGGAGGLPASWMYRGGFLACAVLAAVVIADVRQAHLGPLAWLLAWRPLRWIGKISYGIYLWHWPIIVYLTPQRTGWSLLEVDVARVALTLVLSATSFYLVERPIRQANFAGWARRSLVPAAAAVTASALVVGTIPAVVVSGASAPSTAAVSSTSVQTVPGAGGYASQVPISLPAGTVVDAAHPLRVLLMGDSVMYVASTGIEAALQATGEVVVDNMSIPGFGLSTATNWRTSIPSIIAADHPQLIIGTWSWDNNWALADPTGYRSALEQAVRLMLTPGNGVDGVIFVQFPPTGPVIGQTPSVTKSTDAGRAAGERAWNAIVESMPRAFPGQVMYLPIAPSVLLDGRFTPWLPPATQPGAPTKDWVRVRMVDDVHLCPAGVVRYSDALLADLTDLYHLLPAAPGWWAQSWTAGARFNSPPGSCPDDHPPPSG